MKALVLVMCISVSWLSACPSNPPAAEGSEASHEGGKGFHFGWLPGDRFDVVYSRQVKGETLEVTTRGTVRAEGNDLRVTFEPVKLSDKDKKLTAAGGTHAFLDVWPDLVVNKKTGELLAVDGNVTEPQKNAAARRWGTLSMLAGYDLEVGKQRAYQSEVEAGEGLLLPVKVTERYSETPELGHKVEFTRTYEGEPVKKLWQVMLGDSGAPKSAVDAVQQAAREEKLVVLTDPQTLHHLRIEESSTFTVTTLDKKSERVDLYTESDRWQFTWTR